VAEEDKARRQVIFNHHMQKYTMTTTTEPTPMKHQIQTNHQYWQYATSSPTTKKIQVRRRLWNIDHHHAITAFLVTKLRRDKKCHW
jgi:hypothetical protein